MWTQGPSTLRPFLARKRRWIRFSVRDCADFCLADVSAQSRTGKRTPKRTQKTLNVYLVIKITPVRTEADVDAVDQLWEMYDLAEEYGYLIAGPETINLNSGK
jgi:hypothetical protein